MTAGPERGRMLALVAAAAIAATIITSAQLSIPLKDTPPRPVLLLLELLEWGLWAAAMAPVAWWLDARWGFRVGRWPGALALHLTVAVVGFLGYNAAMTVLRLGIPDAGLAELGFANAYAARLGLRLPTALSVYAAIVAAGYGAWWLARFHRREAQRAQLEAQLATARLRALRMQLHPHFLFNTLHTIAGHVREGERETAVDLIARLSQLLRRSLDEADRQEVTLAEELEFVRDYLDLERARFGDALTTRFDIAFDVGGAAVPSLVLQPLIENAIRHGIARSEGPGELRIGARRDNGRLVLEVADDGPGYDPARANAGLGLRNTRERLATLYGDAQRFEIARLPGGGTLARLELPFRAGSDGGD